MREGGGGWTYQVVIIIYCAGLCPVNPPALGGPPVLLINVICTKNSQYRPLHAAHPPICLHIPVYPGAFKQLYPRVDLAVSMPTHIISFRNYLPLVANREI